MAVEKRDLAVRIGAGKQLVQTFDLLPGGLDGIFAAFVIYTDGHDGVHGKELDLCRFRIGRGGGAASQEKQAAKERKKTLHD